MMTKELANTNTQIRMRKDIFLKQVNISPYASNTKDMAQVRDARPLKLDHKARRIDSIVMLRHVDFLGRL